MIFLKGIQHLNNLGKMLEIFESDVKVCISTILTDCVLSLNPTLCNPRGYADSLIALEILTYGIWFQEVSSHSMGNEIGMPIKIFVNAFRW